MRNFFFILLCIGMVSSFSSCGDDDDNSIVITSENLAGTWDVSSLTSENETLIVTGSTTTTNSSTPTALTITFNADGSWSSAGDFERTVVVLGNETLETVTGIGSGTFTASGNIVTLTGATNIGTSLNVVPFRVDAFTENVEVLLIAEEDDVVSVLGTETGTRFDARMTLER